MVRAEIAAGVAQVGLALREPEEFALKWHRGEANYRWPVWLFLILTSIAGTMTYGMTMGILGGPTELLLDALRFTVAAGLAWAVPLPALYILNSLTGSRLAASTTLLAAVVTTSFGGLAMIASIPINWFLTVAIPEPRFVLFENIVVFTGVGVAMIDVFSRVMETLEPRRGRSPAWCLILVGAIGLELFYALGLFNLGA